jgi:hypothetical protein
MDAHVCCNRRNFLKVGVLGATGGLSLLDWLAARAHALQEGRTRPAAADAVVLIWFGGGPSHIDTFDPKPDAPAEIRGPFKAISTNVPGIQLCEHLPRLAKMTDKFALVRSVSTALADHNLGSQLMQTGYPPLPAFDVPSYGAVASKLLGSRGGSLPPYVCLSEGLIGSGAGFLGASLNPFTPGSGGDLDGPKRITPERAERRRSFRAAVDSSYREVEQANDYVKAVGKFYDQAFTLISSPEAREALDVKREPKSAKDAYGPMGEQLLLARRLLEGGVRFVTVGLGGWDTHSDNFGTLTKQLPGVDQAIAAFLADLEERGLLSKTLVLMTGEFGRTPGINGNAGRDHYSKVFSMAFAGAGVKGGRVVGSSDKHGAEVVNRPVGPADIAATIYDRLGVDYLQSVESPEGVRTMLSRGGKPIHELF